MPTTHLSVLGLDVQRVVTPLEAGDFDADRVRLVRDEADPEQGRDPDDCAAGAPRTSAHVAKTVIEQLSRRHDATVDETRLPFDAPFTELYAATTSLLRETTTDSNVHVNLASAPPQVAAAFYAARTALVDGGEVDRATITILTVPATDRRDLAAISDLRGLVGEAETAASALSEFQRVADGPAAAAVAQPLRIALSDLRHALAEASGESRGQRQSRPARVSSSRDGSPLGAMTSYVGRAREQLVDLVETDQPRPDPSDTRDPNAVLDALESWLDAETKLLSPVEDDPHELLARFRTSCEARFGKFEDEATISLFDSLDRFEAHLDAYLDARMHLSSAAEPVSETTDELVRRADEVRTRLAEIDENGLVGGDSTLTLESHTLSPLGDLEATVLHVLATGPPRSRPRTRRAVAANLRERAEHHGIVAGARDEDSWSSFESFCVRIARNSEEGDRFEKRLSNALRPRLDVAVEALCANGYVRTRERRNGRDALEPSDAGQLWGETTDWESFCETVVDDVLRDCVERDLD
ncbi:hypothetical protein E6P09_11600 [Haloferax mediterranei ATCC 33500]|uniref:Uncharacterized protein n=1 Tax=Haloferax mediterranei (strain ATCC 33500 / DSM 1411 / JCM 8866 / NBRC 14739 / NCIMB 2177 / R-4) TaxID=523841 RepID=I3R5B2_HALMT|nr:DUF6293 family protein [Haloferax mediterranei]AFK19422.1 hypothetical protein HFX_1716 [Haloferax mediterranei ATCC 33500]AHZ21228.1 hypothetical protein BM92_00530 [Haloferax mediterranei ATCC 33500]EMA04389.1 hypothetical protein C439_01902 [Haloferax mediterranei ATCC 33500]MDX5989526.1 DUF6293 family protein [Haloferax mediterranei ATCC 33500]QCQ75883.1 hypothetical protein E6P09_11600 [Haloferax mediterranei ATCC 33500]